MSEYLRVFRVVRSDRTRVDSGHVLAHGVEFPTGTCYVQYQLDSFPPDQRLGGEHVSRYDSIEDVRQGTGGEVELRQSIETGNGRY